MDGKEDALGKGALGVLCVDRWILARVQVWHLSLLEGLVWQDVGCIGRNLTRPEQESGAIVVFRTARK